MDAIGRGTEMMDDLSAWCGIASNAALAVGLAYLGVACLTEPALSRPIGWVALATAALEVAIIAAGQITGLDTVENVLGLVTGACSPGHRDRAGAAAIEVPVGTGFCRTPPDRHACLTLRLGEPTATDGSVAEG